MLIFEVLPSKFIDLHANISRKSVKLQSFQMWFLDQFSMPKAMLEPRSVKELILKEIL